MNDKPKPNEHQYTIATGLRGCYSDPYTIIATGTLPESGDLSTLRDELLSTIESEFMYGNKDDPESPEAFLLKNCYDGITLDDVVADAAKYIRGEGGYKASYLPLCLGSHEGYGLFVWKGWEDEDEGAADAV